MDRDSFSKTLTKTGIPNRKGRTRNIPTNALLSK